MEVGRNIIWKWKLFLQDLETRHGLRVDNDGHVWLLHHLYLDLLNEQIMEWAAHWNAHTICLKREKNKSPRRMFLQGTRERNAPGMREVTEAHEEAIEDLAKFGVDYDAMEDGALIDHLQAHNGNPFHDHAPNHFNKVRCEAPEPPLTVDQLRVLDNTLREDFDLATKNMEVWKLIWDRALRVCHAVW